MKDKTELEQLQETDELEKNDEVAYTEVPSSGELVKPVRMKSEDIGKQLRSVSSRSFNCQGKNLKINIPLTTPSRTFSAISYLVWEDLVNQSSKKCTSEGMSKLHVNKTKLHHADKMIRGAFVELYKGLGYLKTYRYIINHPNLKIRWKISLKTF